MKLKRLFCFEPNLRSPISWTKATDYSERLSLALSSSLCLCQWMARPPVLSVQEFTGLVTHSLESPPSYIHYSHSLTTSRKNPSPCSSPFNWMKRFSLTPQDQDRRQSSSVPSSPVSRQPSLRGWRPWTSATSLPDHCPIIALDIDPLFDQVDLPSLYISPRSPPPVPQVLPSAVSFVC